MTTTRTADAREIALPSVANILRVYRSATDSQLRRGVEWYADAHSLALALDPHDPGRAAGIISALSPQTPWTRNVTLAASVYADGFASRTMGRAIASANAIYNGAHPLDVLRGPKVRAFYGVILDPTDPHSVVVDRHAASIACGHVLDNDLALRAKGGYERFAELYRQAARILGVSPSTCQAVAWVVWRETAIRTAAHNRSLAA